MKMLKKLALVSAVSMISAGAFAMEAMDDETMSATTGQDGIKINVVLPTIADSDNGGTGAGAAYGDGTVFGLSDLDATPTGTTTGAPDAAYIANTIFRKGLVINQVIVHDGNGLTGLGLASNPADDGAILIGNGTAADSTVIYEEGTGATLTPIVLEIDATGNANNDASNTDAMLNIKVTLPTLHIKTGAIYVANSNGAGVAVDNASAAIMNGNEIVLGASTMNIQLGNENQGGMIVMNTSLTGGLTINNFALNDVGGSVKGGSIAVASMGIKNQSNADLSLGVRIDAADSVSNPGAVFGQGAVYNGLVITLTQFGDNVVAGLGGADITMTGVKLGSAAQAALGTVEIKGLQLAGTSLVIMGK